MSPGRSRWNGICAGWRAPAMRSSDASLCHSGGRTTQPPSDAAGCRQEYRSSKCLRGWLKTELWQHQVFNGRPVAGAPPMRDR